MEILKGITYFDKQKLGKRYPYINKDMRCDVVIIGGGIDGAIVNYYLSSKFKTILVDKGRFALGDTVAATALLEYQLDDFAADLQGEVKQEDVGKLYKLGLESIDKMEQITKKIGNTFGFKRKPSFVYSDKEKDVKAFETEYAFRKKLGLPVQFITQKNNPFPFAVQAGLYCENGGAELNPYRFTHALLENSGGKKFENTEVVAIEKNDNGLVCVTSYGYKIFCKKVICATGFNETLLSKKPLSEKYVSYTIVTNPMPNLAWEGDALVQDFMDPYHYMRKLPDQRIIFGGEDVAYKKTIDEKTAKEKYKVLLEQLKTLFPAFKDDLHIEYSFCGLFASTKNNLGIISKTQQDNVYLFSSCGANGIINAFFGVDLLLSLFENKPHWLEPLFSMFRKVY